MNQAIAKTQAGIMLLEALIAILIFSLGILSLVALQATSIQLTSDAKYRTDASLLANRLIGQMWVAAGATATDKVDTLKNDFISPDGAAYKTWLEHVKDSNALPGVTDAEDVESTYPTVAVTPDGTGTSAQVVVTVFWRTPQMNGNARHRHVVESQIAFQD